MPLVALVYSPDDLTTRERSIRVVSIIFAALAAAQVDGTPVGGSRTGLSHRFDLTRDEVAAIEREGVDKDWGPL